LGKKYCKKYKTSEKLEKVCSCSIYNVDSTCWNVEEEIVKKSIKMCKNISNVRNTVNEYGIHPEYFIFVSKIFPVLINCSSPPICCRSSSEFYRKLTIYANSGLTTIVDKNIEYLPDFKYLITYKSINT